jgi:Tfp pilus assembly protein PilN
MSTLLTTPLQNAAMPRVNLLPPQIAEAAKLRKVQALLGLGLGLTVVGVVALYVSASGAVGQAQDQVDAGRATSTSLQKEAAKYADVPKTRAQLLAAQADLETAMGEEVRYSYLLNDLSLSMPSKIWLKSLTINQTLGAASTGAGGSSAVKGAFGTPGIGTVTFEATGPAYNDVAVWLESLRKQPAYADATFTKASESAIGPTRVVNFSSSVTITDKAYSNRYTQKAGS